MKFKFSLSILLLTGFTVACAPKFRSEVVSSEASESSADLTAEFVALVKGVYEMPCEGGIQDTFVFQENGNVVVIGRDFGEADENCSGLPVGIFVLEVRVMAATLGDEEGVYEVDIMEGPNYLVSLDETFRVTSNSEIGEELLELGVPTLVNGYFGQSEIGTMKYTLMKITENSGVNSLKFGDVHVDEALDASSPEKRPVVLADFEVSEDQSLNYLHQYAGISFGKLGGSTCVVLDEGSMQILNLIATDFAVQDQRYYSDSLCEVPAGNIVRIFNASESVLGDVSEGLDRLDLSGMLHIILARTSDQKTAWVGQCGDLDAALTVGQSYSANGICGSEPANEEIFSTMYRSNNSIFLASGEAENAPSGNNANDRLDAGLESFEFVPVW